MFILKFAQTQSPRQAPLASQILIIGSRTWLTPQSLNVFSFPQEDT